MQIVTSDLAFVGGKVRSRFRAYVNDAAELADVSPVVEFDTEEVLDGRLMRSVTFTIDTLRAGAFAAAHDHVLDAEHLAAVVQANAEYLATLASEPAPLPPVPSAE